MSDITETDFDIVQATPAHVDRIVGLFDAYRQFYGEPADPDRCRRFLTARVKHGDTVVFFAAEEEPSHDPALGFTILYPSFHSVLMAPMWVLNDIYVGEQARRRGVAKALIERARDLVMETNAQRLSLETGTTNEPSHKLYESLGFQRDTRNCTYFLHAKPLAEL